MESIRVLDISKKLVMTGKYLNMLVISTMVWDMDMDSWFAQIIIKAFLKGISKKVDNMEMENI